MINETAPVPMFEAFLRQAEPPAVGVLSERLDWPLALIAFFAFMFTDGPEWTFFAGVLAAMAIIYGMRSYRRLRLSRIKPSQRMEYERWTKIRRLKKLLRDKRLKKKVPEPVLMTLERAARTWHDTRESVASFTAIDPEIVAELQQGVDAAMSAAAAAADPVVLRDDQYRKDLRQMEQDSDLMARVCLRIQQEEAQMRHWAAGAEKLGLSSSGSLRERLEIAQRERALAEAELDTLI
jgi:hypothetical protein